MPLTLLRPPRLLKLHRDHVCKACGRLCAWCARCGLAHCFEHVHEGFDGGEE